MSATRLASRLAIAAAIVAIAAAAPAQAGKSDRGEETAQKGGQGCKKPPRGSCGTQPSHSTPQPEPEPQPWFSATVAEVDLGTVLPDASVDSTTLFREDRNVTVTVLGVTQSATIPARIVLGGRFTVRYRQYGAPPDGIRAEPIACPSGFGAQVELVGSRHSGVVEVELVSADGETIYSAVRSVDEAGGTPGRTGVCLAPGV